MSAHPWPWSYDAFTSDIRDAMGVPVLCGMWAREFEAILAMRAEAYAAGYAAGQEAMREGLRNAICKHRFQCEFHPVGRSGGVPMLSPSSFKDQVEQVADAFPITRDAQEPPR